MFGTGELCLMIICLSTKFDSSCSSPSLCLCQCCVLVNWRCIFLCRELAKDFVVSGTASESLYGACESMYKPNMVCSLVHLISLFSWEEDMADDIFHICFGSTMFMKFLFWAVLLLQFCSYFEQSETVSSFFSHNIGTRRTLRDCIPSSDVISRSWLP